MVNQSKSTQVTAATISNIANPALLLLISLAVITAHYAVSTEQFVRWFSISTLLLMGPALFYTLWTWHKEKAIDLDITRREDRIVPLLLVSLGAVIGGYLVNSRLTDSNLLVFSNTLAAMLITLTIVTFVWKISLHAATLMALTTLLVLFRSPYFILLYPLIIPVGWARLTLKQHTLAQLLAGSIIGVLVTYMATILFRT